MLGLTIKNFPTGTWTTSLTNTHKYAGMTGESNTTSTTMTNLLQKKKTWKQLRHEHTISKI